MIPPVAPPTRPPIQNDATANPLQHSISIYRDVFKINQCAYHNDVFIGIQSGSKGLAKC